MKKLIRPTRYRIGTVVAAFGGLLAILSIVQEMVGIGLDNFPVRGPATVAIVIAGAGLMLSSFQHDAEDDSDDPRPPD